MAEIPEVEIIENFVPFKANTKTGLLIEPTYLERNKIQREVPIRSDGQTMTTGLHSSFNGHIKGDNVSDLYFTSGSVVNTNNLSPITGSDGLRLQKGTNAIIDIFSTYTDGDLRDSNFENNHAAQAPIKPYLTTKPNDYISHRSSTLLGNVIKGKTSNIYCRTLRNGKETDF